ncbi:copper resistance protein CopC [Nonomuraea sp. NBC_01738]|uniref:copper resistance CopC family protein n=1 Tax=Nonomuraea sp. NBC_01738 TaxID=2976003 RepID=UPI002E0F3143|nr:copper resistance protein CopC [Nonomuraea sp. NBC_01738]
MKKSPFAALTAILAALFVAGVAAPAYAHDALKGSDPGKNATVKTVDEVTLEFTNSVRMPFVIVRGGDGEHQLGKPEVDGHVVKQRLKSELADGKYTIAYRVVSSDGHPIEGEIPFTVKGAPKPESTPSASESSAAAVPVTPAPAPSEQVTTQAAQSAEQPSASFPVWLIIVVGALVGIGFGFLLSMRKKKP